MSSSTAQQIVGQRRLERQPLAAARVGEGQPLGVQERPRQALHGPDVVRRRGCGRRRRAQSPTIGWPMALRCTRIWWVRPVAIATRISVTPGSCLRPGDAGHGGAGPARARRHLLAVHRVAADRQVDALAVVHHAPDQRDVFLLDLAVVELARQLLVRRRRSWPRPSRPRCPCRGDARCRAAPRRRCRSGPSRGAAGRAPACRSRGRRRDAPPGRPAC